METNLIAFVKENKHLSRVHMDFGWGNGYVAIPEGHPCYGLDYDDVHVQYPNVIDVNGGLTFASIATTDFWPEKPEGNWWVVGFDTCHSWDTLDMWPTHEIVMMEANKLKEQLESITNGNY
jgi:hypothetical protein